jgi:hypothetical protein
MKVTKDKNIHKHASGECFVCPISPKIGLVSVVQYRKIWGNDCSKYRVNFATGKVVEFEGYDNVVRWARKHNYELYHIPILINGSISYNRFYEFEEEKRS